jgi:hypothetical protein
MEAYSAVEKPLGLEMLRVVLTQTMCPDHFVCWKIAAFSEGELEIWG